MMGIDPSATITVSEGMRPYLSRHRIRQSRCGWGGGVLPRVGSRAPGWEFADGECTAAR